VISGFSDLILELYDPEVGDHTRSAVGMMGLPLGMPVKIEAKIELHVTSRATELRERVPTPSEKPVRTPRSGLRTAAHTQL
jgi:hypothetical protein